MKTETVNKILDKIEKKISREEDLAGKDAEDIDFSKEGLDVDEYFHRLDAIEEKKERLNHLRMKNVRRGIEKKLWPIPRSSTGYVIVRTVEILDDQDWSSEEEVYTGIIAITQTKEIAEAFLSDRSLKDMSQGLFKVTYHILAVGDEYTDYYGHCE